MFELDHIPLLIILYIFAPIIRIAYIRIYLWYIADYGSNKDNNNNNQMYTEQQEPRAILIVIPDREEYTDYYCQRILRGLELLGAPRPSFLVPCFAR